MFVGGVKFKAEVDFSQAKRSVEGFQSGYSNQSLKITPQVDLRGLHDLNKTLKSKEEHLKKVIRIYGQNTIKPKVNLTQLHSLNQLLGQLEAKKTNIAVNVTENVKRKVTEEVSSSETKARQSDQGLVQYSKDIKGNGKILEEIKKAIKAQKKGLFGGLKSVGGSILNGIAISLTENLGKGFERGLNKGLSEIIISLDAVGEAIGTKLSTTPVKFAGVFDKLIKDLLEAGSVRDQVREIINQEKAANQEAEKELKRLKRKKEEIEAARFDAKKERSDLEYTSKRQDISAGERTAAAMELGLADQKIQGIEAKAQKIENRIDKLTSQIPDYESEAYLAKIEEEVKKGISERLKVYEEIKQAVLPSREAVEAEQAKQLGKKAAEIQKNIPFIQKGRGIMASQKEAEGELEISRVEARQFIIDNINSELPELLQKEMDLFKRQAAKRKGLEASAAREQLAFDLEVKGLPSDPFFDSQEEKALQKKLFSELNQLQKEVEVIQEQVTGKETQIASHQKAIDESIEKVKALDEDINRLMPSKKSGGVNSESLMELDSELEELKKTVAQNAEQQIKDTKAIAEEGESGAAGSLALAQPEKKKAINKVKDGLVKSAPHLATLSKELGKGALNVAKFSFGVSKAAEQLAFDFIPGARPMKRVLQVGAPILGAGVAASAVPGLLPAMGTVAQTAGAGSQFLLSPAIDAIASGVGGAITSALPGFGSAAIGGAAETLTIAGGNAIAGALPTAAAIGMTAKTTNTLLVAANDKIKQLTDTGSNAAIAGENLANKFFSLGGEIRDFQKTLEYQKERAKVLRMQLPSAKEIKALPPQQQVQKASTMARIAAKGMADQRAILNSLPASSRTQGGQVGQARALLGEFGKQLKKAKRVLAKNKIDIDDVVDVKNITASVEIVEPMKDLGKDVNRGIAKGIKQEKSHIKAMDVVAIEIMNTIDDKLERRSPARTMIRRGVDIVKGLSIGIVKNRKLLAYSMIDMGKDAIREGQFIGEKIVDSVKNPLRKFKRETLPKLELKYKGDFDEKAVGEGAGDLSKMGSLLALMRPSVTGNSENDALLKRISENYLKFEKAEREFELNHLNFLENGNASKLDQQLAKIKKGLKGLLNNDQVAPFFNRFKNGFDAIYKGVKQIGTAGALSFGALALGGILAFKAIGAGIQSAVMGIKDLFFNAEKNIEAFKNIYSLGLKFKAAGLTSRTGFNLAQSQGIGFEGVEGQAGIVASLQKTVGKARAKQISQDIAQGLIAQGLQGENLSGALTAFTQIGSKGKFQAEEGYQLRERLPSIAQLSQSALGVSASQMEDMQRSGKILSTEYLPAIAEELKKAGNAGKELPTAEIQRAANNIVAFRASLGKGTLDTSRPLLKGFNALLSQAELVKGGIVATTALFGGLGITGVITLTQLALQSKLLTKAQAALGKTILANKVAIAKMTALSLGAAAALGIAAATWGAMSKKSLQLEGLEDMTGQAKSLADSLKEVKKEIEGTADRFGGRTDGNFAQNLFSGDLASRFVNFASQGFGIKKIFPNAGKHFKLDGLEGYQKSREDIALSDLISSGSDIFSKALKSGQAYSTLIDEVKGKQSEITAKKIEVTELIAIKGDREKIQALQREISDLTMVVGKSKKELSAFMSFYDKLKDFKEGDAYKGLDAGQKANFDQLFDSYQKQAPIIKGVLDEMMAKTQFVLKFKLSQASIEGAKFDFEKTIAAIELSLLSNNSTNAALNASQAKSEAFRQKLAATETQAGSQRSILSSMAPEVKTGIDKILGSKLENATLEQLNQALVKLEAAGDTAGEEIKLGIEKAKELKQTELEVLQLKKEVARLELENSARSLNRELAANQIVATGGLRTLRRQDSQNRTAIANSGLKGQAASNLLQALDFAKLANELDITTTKLININRSLDTGFDGATKQWFLNLIGKPASNISDAVNQISSEQLQELKSAYGEEISSNPLKEAFLQQIEKAVSESEKIDNDTAQLAQSKQQLLDSFGQVYKQYADYNRQIADQLEDEQSKVIQARSRTVFKQITNQLDTNTLGVRGFRKRIKDVYRGLIDALSNYSTGQLTVKDQSRQNARALRDLKYRFKELYLEMSPVLTQMKNLGLRFDDTGRPIQTFATNLNNLANTINEVSAYMIKSAQNFGSSGGGLNSGGLGSIKAAQSSLPEKAKKGSSIVVRRTDQKHKGMHLLRYDLVKDGKIVDSFINGYSGQANKQFFGTNKNHVGRNMSPLPDGHWKINMGQASQVAGGKTNNDPNSAVGKYWMHLDPQFKTGRSAIGAHLENQFLGSAGCLVFTDESSIRKLAGWVEQNGISDFNVDLKTIVEGKINKGIRGVSKIDAIRRAIIGKESGGNFKAVNPHSGALGYGQVMPANVASWTKQALGKSLTQQQFLNNPDAQIKTINHRLEKAFAKALKKGVSEDIAVRMVASEWYSGRQHMYDDKKAQTYGAGKYPSIASYTLDILKRYLKEMGTVAPSVPTAQSSFNPLPGLANNFQLASSDPLSQTSYDIADIEAAKAKQLAEQAEQNRLEFDSKLSEQLESLDTLMIDLSDSARSTHKSFESIKNSLDDMGKQYGLLIVNPVEAAIDGVKKAYNAKLTEISDLEFNLKRSLGLKDDFNALRDKDQLKAVFEADHEKSREALADALKQFRKDNPKPEIPPELQTKIDQIVSGIVTATDEQVDTALELFGLTEDLEKRTRSEGSQAAIAVGEKESSEYQNSIYRHSTGLERGRLEFEQSQRFGRGLSFGMPFTTDRGEALKNRLSEIQIETERLELLKQINDAKAQGLYLDNEQGFEQDKEAVNLLAEEKKRFSEVTNNPWLEQTKEGIMTIKDALGNAINEGKNLWESLGIAALKIIGDIAQQLALTALSSSIGGGGVAGQKGGGFWQQVFGGVIGSFSEGYVPNFAGGYNPLQLGMATNAALKRENSPYAFVGVLDKREPILSYKNGDASLFKQMKSSGAWDAYKNNYASSIGAMRVSNFANGYYPNDTASTMSNATYNNRTSHRGGDTYNYYGSGGASNFSDRQTAMQKIRAEKQERSRLGNDD